MKKKVFFNILMITIILTGFVCIHSNFLSLCDAKSVKTSYKKYSIFKYRNSDILCEPYTVNKDDWLYKIFRKKGEISEKDFPKFITIFKKINPQINNVDAIEPGIHIVIPLKEVNKEEYDQTAPGSVEIPVIEFSALSKNFDLTPYLQKHDVKKGETISEIVDKEFLQKGGGLSKEGLKAFELANPDIQNINIIHEGTQINLPDPSIKSQSWFQSLLTGNLPGTSLKNNRTAAPTSTQPSAVQTRLQEHELAQLRKYSALIGGTLLSKGRMYFPGKDGDSQVLDLSLAPVIETQDGQKILIISGQNVNSQLLESVQSYWKGIKTQLISETTDEFKKRVKEKITKKDAAKNRQETFSMTQEYKKVIKMLLTHVDNEYIPDETVSFTVSNIQLEARFGRVVQDQTKDILINFGNVYGAALDALNKREFNIISLKPKMTMEEIAQLIFSHLGFTIWMNPSFFTEDSVQTLEGLYAAKGQNKLFFHTRSLDRVTTDYLRSENIKIVPSSSVHSEK